MLGLLRCWCPMAESCGTTEFARFGVLPCGGGTQALVMPNLWHCEHGTLPTASACCAKRLHLKQLLNCTTTSHGEGRWWGPTQCLKAHNSHPIPSRMHRHTHIHGLIQVYNELQV